MSSLENIADAKVQASVTRRLDILTPAIVSIKQEMNGRGLLVPPTSMTATKICDACISLFDEICNDMKVEYGMVLDNAIWPNETLCELLISKARCHFDTVTGRALAEIRSSTQSPMFRDIQEQLCNDASKARDRTLTDLSLFIDGHSKIQMRKKTIRAIAYLPKFILSLIKK